jgi:DNA polymerase III gamma/tau subunit
VLGIADVQIISDFVAKLQEGNAQAALDLLDSAEEQGTDLAQLSKQLIDFLRDQIRVKVGKGENHAPVLKILTKLVSAYSEFRHVDNPKLLLEIVILDAATQKQPSNSMSLQQTQPKVVVEKKEVKSVKAPATKPSKQTESKQIDNSTEQTDRWKMVIQLAKKKDFKLMMLLRGCQYQIFTDKLVLSTHFNSAATDLNESERNSTMLGVVQEYFPTIAEIEIKVNGDGNGTQVESEEKVNSNADLVESIF